MSPSATMLAARGGNGGGALVLNVPFIVVFSWFGGEPGSGLAVAVGFADPISGLEATCAGMSADDGPGEGQIVITPSGAAHPRTSGDAVPVAVYAFTGSDVGDPCKLAAAPVVATGTVKYSYRAANFGGGGPGATVVRASVSGVVDLAGGGQALLEASWRQVTRPDGTVVYDAEPVRLTPL